MARSLTSVSIVALLARGGSAANGTATADISSNVIGSIPGDFLGISSNWINFPGYCGNGSAEFPGQPWFVPLLANTRPCSNCTGPSIRINGDGQSPFWGPAWPDKPPNEWGSSAKYNVSTGAVEALTSTLMALNGTFIVGLPFQVYAPSFKQAPYNATLAVQMAMGVKNVVAGRVPVKYELGNEPDWDAVRADFYHNEYEWEAFWNAYATNVSSPETGIPPSSIVGGVWASCGWCVNATGYLARQAGLMGELNVHWYPLNRGSQPTMADLLADDATSAALTKSGYANASAAAAAAGVRFVIRESNNINMGGTAGISDTFAGALWGLDAMFSVASIGGSAWITNQGTQCFNSTGGIGTPYAPFCVNETSGSPYAPYMVRPEWYAHVAGARAMLASGGAPASLLSVSTAGDASVKVYALTREGNDWDGLTGRVMSVVMVNKNLVSAPGQPGANNATAVTLCLPSTVDNSKSFMEWLTAADGAVSTYGVSLAGQTFDGTTSGSPKGAIAREALTPNAVLPAACSAPLSAGASASYTVWMPAETAAVAYFALA